MAYTFTTLKAALSDYLQVQGEATFNAHISEIIQLGEARIAREVDTPDQQAFSIGSVSAVTPALNAPIDFISPITLLFAPGLAADYYPLILKNETFLYEAYGLNVNGGSPSGRLGVPKYYAIQGAAFSPSDYPPGGGAAIITGPPPNQTYQYQLSYRKIPDSLTNSLSPLYSTWIATYYPQCLLYSCICEGYNFLKGDPTLMAQYEKYFVSAIAEVKMGMAEQSADQFRKAS